jgi:hypothetical protein
MVPTIITILDTMFPTPTLTIIMVGIITTLITMDHMVEHITGTDIGGMPISN